jgi:sugar/nucleoside kinase (ribokinase family)
MSLLVIGSLALDTIETPFGKAERTLGGSATYLSTSASYFVDDIKLVGIIGYDFPKEELEFLKSKNINISGIVHSDIHKTFFWHGKYDYDLNTRESLVTELNAFDTFDPVIKDEYRNIPYVCLGNLNPELQLKVLDQMNDPKLVMCDTMNFWIEGKYDSLMKTLSRIDLLVINDSEARELSREYNLVSAARKIISLGPEIVIIKKGEHGALLFTKDMVFSAPAYPLEKVFDPTGAGDTFAGGLMGWLARTNDLSQENLKLAVIYGSVMASLVVEKFSIEGIRYLTPLDIKERINEFKKLTHFEEMQLAETTKKI